MISHIRDHSHGEASVPPLRDGDMLSMDEFERRWEAMPHLKRAELIEGRVYMNAVALRWDWHSEPNGILGPLLGLYAFSTPSVQFGPDPSVRMEASSMPQPDGVLRIKQEHGGSTRIEKGYLVGSPEFVAEISGSTEKYDLKEKKALYLRAGVQEYFNWSVLNEQITLFSRAAKTYVKLATARDGILRSRALPGLWFDPAAMIRGDQTRPLEVLQQGLQSPEHHAFVQELERRRSQIGGQT